MILLVAGARPNFVKLAPLVKEFISRNIDYKILHTGQHKDYLMSQSFFDQLSIPEPDYYGIENIPEETSYIIIFGDVNSSREAAEKAYLMGIKIIHIEAGLRSFDLSMPEEKNRIAIDRYSNYYFVTEKSGVKNLRKEGYRKNIYLVGNLMIDSLEQSFPRSILLTLHRPSNVDNPEKLELILSVIDKLNIPVKFPVHPRVKLKGGYKNILLSDPLPYNDFISEILLSNLIITDSGGVQEETSYLGRQCLTLRDNTERPITLKYSNQLVTFNNLTEKVNRILNIPFWDGRAAKRITDIIQKEILK